MDWKTSYFVNSPEGSFEITQSNLICEPSTEMQRNDGAVTCAETELQTNIRLAMINRMDWFTFMKREFSYLLF